MSNFEMESLLLGVLGQPVTIDSDGSKKQVQAILVRDIHDLYKYGILPAHVEEKMQAVDLLDYPTVTV